jgi:hypothetical protein
MQADCHSRRRLHPMTREFPSPSARRLLRGCSQRNDSDRVNVRGLRLAAVEVSGF